MKKGKMITEPSPGHNMILRVHIQDGTIYSINLMPNLSKSGYIRSSTPIINFPNQEW